MDFRPAGHDYGDAADQPHGGRTTGSTTRAVGLTGPAVHFRSRTSSLFFAYTVVAADSDADGISVAADALSLNGGSTKAAADGTTDAGLTHLTHAALTPGSGHKVDGSKNEVPVVSSVSFVGSPAGRETYELGETIELKVEFHRFLDWFERAAGGADHRRADRRWRATPTAAGSAAGSPRSTSTTTYGRTTSTPTGRSDLRMRNRLRGCRQSTAWVGY